MEWLERMNGAIDYIEENLTANIELEKVAQIALCSNYHFQRMFSFIANVPIAEYIRRRRLTLAAQELKCSDIKVIDIALKYGYDSPDSFARAFKRLHGMTPTAARKQNVILKAFPKISFYITLKGDKEMKYRIIKRTEFEVFGKKVKGNELERKKLKEFLNECHDNGTADRIRCIAGYGVRKDPSSKSVFQVLSDFNPNGEFIYMMAAESPSDKSKITSEFERMIIPEGDYAVFTERCLLNEALGKKAGSIWARVPEWFESTGYEYANKPALEMPSYTEYEKIIDIWIPIIKR